LDGNDKSPLDIARKLNLIQERNEDSILSVIDQVVREFPLKVEEFKHGKKGIVGMFMGEVMKRSHGKVDPKLANELLTRRLKEL
jgi:aspartyl-tRNA(Asn)/glutamyl-tRNA(Gln) amidotransferase subunit B